MSADKGMAGLIMAARGSQQVKCTRITVPLSGQEFFTDAEPGMVPGVIELGGNAYSEVRDKDGKVMAVLPAKRTAMSGIAAAIGMIALLRWLISSRSSKRAGAWNSTFEARMANSPRFEIQPRCR